MRPLVTLTRKDQTFEWTDACTKAFEYLKQIVVEAPILRHFDRTKQAYLETDSSDYVSSGILSQQDDEGVLHPVAFFSRKLVAAECNYEIYDKELLAIIRCLENWRPDLEGTDIPVQVLTDHKNLEYFMTTKKLTRRQARWAEFLAGFNFTIVYRSGKQNEKADSLTSRTGDRPAGKHDDREQRQMQTMIPSEKIDREVRKELQIAEGTPAPEENTQERPIAVQVECGQLTDEFVIKVLQMLRDGERHSKEISLPHCTEVDGRLYFRDKLWVSDGEDLRVKLIKEVHTTPASGHPGTTTKTLSLLQRQYYWPRMDRTVT